MKDNMRPSNKKIRRKRRNQIIDILFGMRKL